MVAMMSHLLTAQQDAKQPIKRYPRGYKADRKKAAELGVELFKKLVSCGLVDGLTEDLHAQVSERLTWGPHQNKHCIQRDLPEVGETTKDFYHDDEDEYLKTRQVAGWLMKNGQPENYANYSDGEEFSDVDMN
jgi:hypothetical protein